MSVPGSGTGHRVGRPVSRPRVRPELRLPAGNVPASRQCVRPDLGAVAPGKRADLLVLNADPTADIDNLRDLSTVILNGAPVVDKR